MTQNDILVFGKGGGARVTDYIAKLQEYHLLPRECFQVNFNPPGISECADLQPHGHPTVRYQAALFDDHSHGDCQGYG